MFYWLYKISTKRIFEWTLHITSFSFLSHKRISWVYKMNYKRFTQLFSSLYTLQHRFIFFSLGRVFCEVTTQCCLQLFFLTKLYVQFDTQSCIYTVTWIYSHVYTEHFLNALISDHFPLSYRFIFFLQIVSHIFFSQTFEGFFVWHIAFSSAKRQTQPTTIARVHLALRNHCWKTQRSSDDSKIN